MMYVIIAVISIVVLIFVNFYGKFNENYWKKRGVVFHKKHSILGPAIDFITGDRSFFQVFHEIYKEYPDEPAVGLGSLTSPTLYVKDTTNIHHMVTTGFSSFYHNGVEVNDGDQLADMVLFMNGNRWKLMRQSMTPLFTAAKLKNMFYIIDRSGQDFVKHLKRQPDLLDNVSFDTLSLFCNAAIANAVFGIGTETNFSSPLLDVARNALKPTFMSNLRFAIATTSSTLFKTLKLKFFKKYEDIFIGAMKQVLLHRKQENVKKHDFVDICLNLQKTGLLRDSDTGYEMEPTDELLAAQGFFFFIAGVEPTAAAIQGPLIGIAEHPEIQKKLHEEIDSIFSKYNGQLSYDIVSEMEYLEMVLNEGLRMYPPIGFLTKRCVKDTVLPVGNIRVEKGTRIFNAIYEIHHDSKFFPDPEIFDPERFSGKNEMKDEFFMPFGKGKRACIGARYAKLQAKAGLIYILRHFSIQKMENTKLRFSKEQVQVRPVYNFKFIPRFKE